MKLNGRLELTWTGKDEPYNLERRLLIEDKTKSYGDFKSKNMLIHGDNLLALKALERNFTGKVKCIYIDPPYNTGAAFEHYDDNVEHSIWLNLMYRRMKILKKLMDQSGSAIVVHLDDCEFAYLKIVMDEIFGRNNFVNSIALQSSTPSGTKLAHRNKTILKTKDLLLIYKVGDLHINPQYIPTDNLTNFNGWLEKDKDGNYVIRKFKDVLIENGLLKSKQKLEDLKMSSNPDFEQFVLKNKDKIFRMQPSMPDDIKEKSKNNPNEIIEYYDDNGHKFLAKNGYRFAFISQAVKLYEGKEKVTQLLCDFWNDISFHGTQYEGVVSFPAGKKPESLIKRILSLFTEQGDLVLDSFLGSGTTAAVAQKMNRRWIGIEMGNQVYTHSKVRLDSVIDGSDMGGVSEELCWNGGGGYHFYELSEPLFVKHPIIGVYQFNKSFDINMIRNAICNIEGYTYQEHGLIHGFSSEKHYIHITKDFVNGEYINELINILDDDESISIYALKYQPDLRLPDNIEIIDIMKCVLPKCIDIKEVE